MPAIKHDGHTSNLKPDKCATSGQTDRRWFSSTCSKWYTNKGYKVEDIICSLQDFVVGLSVLVRGSLEEKLRWTFSLYDQGRTKSESSLYNV